ncbi:chemotaxis protein CheW [Arenicella xantha]|uniref:Chemotaxis signal transduction protein n=1 Tax=Arenicella xantha TaxID=644221 RepID=A0A395JRR2_9GAMM|nr:chemotaxis protein CheW [Arenicella xantha]RBP53265.1 chemotaxis signal transduction protein [Arenicella xantha]
MSEQTIDCYILPSTPKPLLLPVECIAEIVAEPVIVKLAKAPASWMQGHVNWQNQRLPVMEFSGLVGAKANDASQEKPHLVVLNPIPGAARKAYSALLCFGDVKRVSVEPNLEFGDAPSGGDRRYIEAVIKLGEKEFLVPKLTALGVAFSYF